MFLMPGLVITWYVTKTPIPEAFSTEMKRYLFARQNKEDGGWGLHIEGESSVFGTAMNYVVLRILGASEEDARMVKARGQLHKLGGAVNGPHWAKFWLSVLGVMDWSAVNPVPPELWYEIAPLVFETVIADINIGFFRIGSPLPHGGGGFTCDRFTYPCPTSGLEDSPSLKHHSLGSFERNFSPNHILLSISSHTGIAYLLETTTIPSLQF